MEILENLEKIRASDYLKRLAKKKHADHEIQDFENSFGEDQRNRYRSLIEAAQETTNECKRSGLFLDPDIWLYLEVFHFDYAMNRLEDLRGIILKTYWRAETDGDKEAMLEKYGVNIGKLLFYEAGRKHRPERTYTERYRVGKKIDIQPYIIAHIAEMSQQVDGSVFKPQRRFFPEGFFVYHFSFACADL